MSARSSLSFVATPMNDQAFSDRFKQLTGNYPFAWQGRLYGKMLGGNLPARCDIPTGLGKTSILAVWLLALAEQARLRGPGVALPRRLVYIVDRRVVVDQATTEAENLLKRLEIALKAGASDLLFDAAAALRDSAASDDKEPFALSPLRGALADNRRWSRDPAKPAIIIGTVDMIGSRLLFSGYGGLGPYGRSQHAALLGQDALVVLDEAHLSRAFADTLFAVRARIDRQPKEFSRPFHVLLLTATQPRPGRSADAAAAPEEEPLRLEETDFDDPTVVKRWRARKHLRFVYPPPEAAGAKPDPNALAQRLAKAALDLARTRGGAIAVFANTVETLKKVYERMCDALAKTPHAKRLLLFTGEIRGKERDDLPNHPIFKVFARDKEASREQPAFLLATAAAEVGVNFDADAAVCDLVSLERMVQRLGRVNRFGENAAGAEVRVILPMGEAALARHLEKLTQKKDFPTAPPADKTEKAKAEKQLDDLNADLAEMAAKLPHPAAWAYQRLKDLPPAPMGAPPPPEEASAAVPASLSEDAGTVGGADAAPPEAAPALPDGSDSSTNISTTPPEVSAAQSDDSATPPDTSAVSPDISALAPSPEVFSASPEALKKILDHPYAFDAYSPASDPPPLDLARLDDWSLTSLSSQDFPRPRVSYWLRGITPDDTVTVTFAWRADLLHAANKDDAAEMAGMLPLDPQETAQLPIGRAAKWLLARAKKQPSVHARKNQDAAAPLPPGSFAVVRAVGGEWKGWEFKDFIESKNLERDIAAGAVLLPTSFGGLKEGFPDEGTDDPASDAVPPKRFQRALLRRAAGGGWEALALGAKPDAEPMAAADTPAKVYRKLATLFAEKHGGHFRLMPRKRDLKATEAGDEEAESETRRVEYFAANYAEVATPGGEDLKSVSGKAVALQTHLDDVERVARRFVERLGLAAPLAEAVALAAAWHDKGKNRENWQRAIGNPDPSQPWAKSGGFRFDRSMSDGYRHEFGSLMEALKNKEIEAHPEQDLILHLIAAHHGHARPEFDPKAYDLDTATASECAEAAREAELRFERLQRRFGHWELAYLEALLKCADGLASAGEVGDLEPPDSPPEPAAADAPVAAQQQLTFPLT